MDKHLPLSGVCVFLVYVFYFNFTYITDIRLYNIYVCNNITFIIVFVLLHTSLHTFITSRLCYFYPSYFYTYSSCIYHIFLYGPTYVYYHIFILFYTMYFSTIDVFDCMGVRRIGCWSPVVTSLAYICTLYVMLL